MDSKVSVISSPDRSGFDNRNGTVKIKDDDGSFLQDILEHCTTVTHVLSLGLTIYILYLCLSPGGVLSLTTWHVLLYTIGWTLLMTEGILLAIKENVFSKRLSQPARVRSHWVVLLLATGLIVGGFGTIVENRARGNGIHFQTEHGLSGIIATILGFVTVFNGIPTLYAAKLRRIISPNLNKLLHAFLGFATVLVGAYATITGYYTGWYRNRSTETMITVSFVVTVIISVWSMFKPILNGFQRIRNMVS